MYLARLACELDEWKRRCVAIVGVYGQRLEAVEAFAERQGFPFPIAADSDRRVIRAYGVYVRINLESWNMARPSVVLVDSEGVVRQVFVGRHQREWPVSEIFWAVVDRHGVDG